MLTKILRTDFNSFIHKSFKTINPGMDYIHNWHIELIAKNLEDVCNGKIKRLIINMPPRALKSVCVSVAWPAWLLGNDPTKRIIVASYSNMLGIKHSVDCRFLLESEWYKQIFHKTKISKKNNQKSKYMTTKHGFRFSTSVGGSVTGEGGDILIIDDPINPVHINSPKRRQKVIDWYEQTFVSRLNDQRKGAIVIVMQRLHDNDLVGHLLKNAADDWQQIKIPAIATSDHEVSLANRNIKIRESEVLNPSRDSLESYRKLEQAMGYKNFAAQYMQEPITEDNSMVKESELHSVDQLPENFDYYVLSLDTAIKISDNSDYSVCTIWGVDKENSYLVSMFRKKMQYPELKNQTLKLINRYKPRHTIIEDKASGQSLIQDLRREGIN